jgi:hypothetical protein
MSWDAHLSGRDWNYTHNCNHMISTVLEEGGAQIEKHWLIGHMGGSWYQLLDGMTGESGANLLRQIVVGLLADPKRFRAMNPRNGWGNYDSLLKVLLEMLLASVDLPCDRWRVSG